MRSKIDKMRRGGEKLVSQYLLGSFRERKKSGKNIRNYWTIKLTIRTMILELKLFSTWKKINTITMSP